MKRQRADNTYEFLRVSGCFCYHGQGYDGCTCPKYIHIRPAQEAEYKRCRKEGQPMETTSLDLDNRFTMKRYLQFQCVGAAIRYASDEWALLEFAEKMNKRVFTLDNHQFDVAFELNGQKQWCSLTRVVDLQKLLTQFDTFEGCLRSYISRVLVWDWHQSKLVHVEHPTLRSLDWSTEPTLRGLHQPQEVARNGEASEERKEPARKRRRVAVK